MQAMPGCTRPCKPPLLWRAARAGTRCLHSIAPQWNSGRGAFAKFAKLVQAVLDADPTTLPRRDIGLAPRGWLDCQALVLPYSTSWEKAHREAVAVMGYTDRVQL